MPVPMTAFQNPQVLIDYPFEQVKFRWQHGKVWAKFHGEPEQPWPPTSHLFHEAILGGTLVTKEQYEST